MVLVEAEAPLVIEEIDVDDVDEVKDAIDAVVVALAPVSEDVSTRECTTYSGSTVSRFAKVCGIVS